MSCGDIVKPSQKESSGDNVYDKLRKRLQRHFLGRKKVSTIAKWNTSLKLTPVPWVLLFSPDGMIIRTKFTCNSSELHDTSLALIDIPEWREGLWREGRVGGERHSFYMSLFKVSFQRPSHGSSPDLLVQRGNWSCHVPWGRIQPDKNLKRLVTETVLELL